MDELIVISDVVTREEFEHLRGMVLYEYVTVEELFNIFSYIWTLLVVAYTIFYFHRRHTQKNLGSGSYIPSKEKENEPEDKSKSVYKKVGGTLLTIFVGVAIIVISELIMEFIIKS